MLPYFEESFDQGSSICLNKLIQQIAHRFLFTSAEVLVQGFHLKPLRKN